MHYQSDVTGSKIMQLSSSDNFSLVHNSYAYFEITQYDGVPVNLLSSHTFIE